MRRLASRGITAFERAFDFDGDAHLQRKPDDIASSPSGAIGAGSVPILGLLLALELGAQQASAGFRVDDGPRIARDGPPREFPRNCSCRLCSAGTSTK